MKELSVFDGRGYIYEDKKLVEDLGWIEGAEVFYKGKEICSFSGSDEYSASVSFVKSWKIREDPFGARYVLVELDLD